MVAGKVAFVFAIISFLFTIGKKKKKRKLNKITIILPVKQEGYELFFSLLCNTRLRRYSGGRYRSFIPLAV